MKSEENFSDLITYISLIIYNYEDKTLENNIKMHLEEINLKSIAINGFFNEHEQQIS
jgi:hypothetical protein